MSKSAGDSRSKLDVLKHPLLIALFSLSVGGFGLSCQQTRTSEKRALLEKQYAVANDLVVYVSHASSHLRSMQAHNKALIRNHLSRAEKNQQQAEIQGKFNALAEAQNRLEVNLAFFFSTEKPLEAFQKIRDSFLTEVNQGVVAMESRKEWEPNLKPLSVGVRGFVCAIGSEMPTQNLGTGKCQE